jgi:hypothetical protein
MAFAGIRKVIREIHSEPGPNGTLSWGRCAATGSFIVAACAILHVVFHTHTLPSMTDAGAFVIAPYAAGRVATAVQSFSSNPVTPNLNQPSAVQAANAIALVQPKDPL